MGRLGSILEGLTELHVNEAEGKKFKNKQELIDFIKTQTNVELENADKDRLNQKRNILYTKIEGADTYTTPVTQLLTKYGIRYEKHLNDYYWIWVK